MEGVVVLPDGDKIRNRGDRHHRSAAAAYVISAIRARDVHREERLAELEKRLTALEAARIN